VLNDISLSFKITSNIKNINYCFYYHKNQIFLFLHIFFLISVNLIYMYILYIFIFFWSDLMFSRKKGYNYIGTNKFKKRQQKFTYIGWKSGFLCDLTIDLTAAANVHISILHADKLDRRVKSSRKLRSMGGRDQGTDLVLKNWWARRQTSERTRPVNKIQIKMPNKQKAAPNKSVKEMANKQRQRNEQKQKPAKHKL